MKSRRKPYKKPLPKYDVIIQPKNDVRSISRRQADDETVALSFIGEALDARVSGGGAGGKIQIVDVLRASYVYATVSITITPRGQAFFAAERDAIVGV